MLINSLEEPDMKLIAERTGTMMFGVNNVTAQFTDILMSYIPPPIVPGSDAAPSAAGAAAGAAAGLESSEEAEEMEFDEEDDTMSASMNGTLGMKACSDKKTCTERRTWCNTEFKDSMPADCLSNFSEYCCGIKAMSQLEECKVEVDLNSGEEEPLDIATISCFEQDSDVDKNK